MPLVPVLCLVVSVVFLGACTNRPHPPLATVASVQLDRYAGLWYEVARLPNSFQQDGASATARYTLQPSGTVEVVNTETQRDGTIKVARGEASAVGESKNARLKVRFKGLASLVPVPEEGNYWILAITPDYSAALVGTPDRNFLWLLARSPKLAPSTQSQLLATARDAGFAVEKLQFNQPSGEAPKAP